MLTSFPLQLLRDGRMHYIMLGPSEHTEAQTPCDGLTQPTTSST